MRGHVKEGNSGKVFPIIRGEIRKERSGHFNQKDDYEVLKIEETYGISYDVEIDSQDHLFLLLDGTITHNSNGMPSSVKDRFSNKWEYVFFFTKSKKYYFDLDAVRKPLAESSKIRANYGWHGREVGGIGRNQPQAIEKMGERWSPSIGANPGDVIEIPYSSPQPKQKYEQN
ncbi:MAG: DNA methyltransferase, partial [Thermoplasmata archaeon]